MYQTIILSHNIRHMSPEGARGDILLDHIPHEEILVRKEIFQGIHSLGIIFHSGHEKIIDVYELLVDSPVKRTINIT